MKDKKQSLNLSSWDPVWQLNRVYYFTYGIFEIFENNLHTEKNIIYVLDYMKKYVKDIRGFYQLDFFNTSIVKIINKIIKIPDGRKYLDDAFGIIRDLINFGRNEFLYLKNTDRGHSEWEKEQICKVLNEIYIIADEETKQEIFELLVDSFSLIEDDGDFSIHSPKEVFVIISNWLNEDFIRKV